MLLNWKASLPVPDQRAILRTREAELVEINNYQIAVFHAGRTSGQLSSEVVDCLAILEVIQDDWLQKAAAKQAMENASVGAFCQDQDFTCSSFFLRCTTRVLRMWRTGRAYHGHSECSLCIVALGWVSVVADDVPVVVAASSALGVFRLAPAVAAEGAVVEVAAVVGVAAVVTAML